LGVLGRSGTDDEKRMQFFVLSPGNTTCYHGSLNKNDHSSIASKETNWQQSFGRTTKFVRRRLYGTVQLSTAIQRHIHRKYQTTTLQDYGYKDGTVQRICSRIKKVRTERTAD
jgi:hypothetical protein